MRKNIAEAKNLAEHSIKPFFLWCNMNCDQKPLERYWVVMLWGAKDEVAE